MGNSNSKCPFTLFSQPEKGMPSWDPTSSVHPQPRKKVTQDEVLERFCYTRCTYSAIIPSSKPAIADKYRSKLQRSESVAE
ncbi:uncharacterized protein L203_106392 [Cryptococcus depauperatus CBS 7841]|uniref:Uncharacterized protein n=1 Tax=Cryptococcus depauperatus CBS 7841 TaxID=1295531 RepID=A0AAJ8M434_9TREE